MTICAEGLELAGWKVEREEGEDKEFNVVAIREGIRSANATRGYGSIAIDVNEDSVAPWNLVVFSFSWLVAAFVIASVEGMNDVITATGCAISLSSIRKCSFNVLLSFFSLSVSAGFLSSNCCRVL
jgi:hypothetical protein